MKKVGKKELLSLISEQVEIHEKQSRNSQKKRQQKARKKAVDRRTSVANDKKLKATIIGVLNKIQKGKADLQPADRKSYLINVLKLIKGEETPINESEEDSNKKAKEVVKDQQDELNDDKVRGAVVGELEQVLVPFVKDNNQADNNDANKDNDQSDQNTQVDMDEIKKQAIAFTTQYILKGKYDDVIKTLKDQFESIRPKNTDDSSDSEGRGIRQPVTEEEAADPSPSLEDDGTVDDGDVDGDPDVQGENVKLTYEQFLTQFLNNNIDSTTNDNAKALRAELLKFLLGEFLQDKYKNYTSLDSIMQRGLIAYDKKMAAKKEKIDKDDKDALGAHDQRVKNVRDAFVRSFMKKRPKFDPNEKTQELINKTSDTESTEETESSEEDITSPAADIVKNAFGNLIDANKKGSAFKPLVQMVDRIIEIFKDSLEKAKTANDEYLQEPQEEEEALQEIRGSKTFRRFFKSKVQDIDSFWGGPHRDFISDIMKPIYGKLFKFVLEKGDKITQADINMATSMIDSSKVVFNSDDNFNETVGRISRYFKKLEKEENFDKEDVLDELANGILGSMTSEIDSAWNSRDSATERGEKRTAADDKRIEYLAQIFKLLQDDETLDSDDEDTWTEALEDVKTKSEDSYRPKIWDYDLQTAAGVAKYLVNTYATSPSDKLEGEILDKVEKYAKSTGDDLNRQFEEDEHPAREKAGVQPVEQQADRQPFYWVEVKDVMNRFFNYIEKIELPPDTTQEAFGMEKLKSFIEKFKDKSDLYKAMKLLKDPTKFRLYSVFKSEEQKTIMWYLSDKKRFGQFMNRFSGEPLFKKVVNSKLGLFGKLFSRWNSYEFDEDGKLKKSRKEEPELFGMDSLPKLGGPEMKYDRGKKEKEEKKKEYKKIVNSPSNLRLEESLKPIIDNMIKEILNK